MSLPDLESIEDIEVKVKMLGKKSGKLQIKYMPAQSNINDVRSYIKELQIRSGRRVDFVMIDYLDLLMPVSAKVSPSDLFVKDKYVSEEIRNFAKEMDILLVTASQLNRASVEEVEFDHSHISGGISKINTADNLFGIFTSRSMREHGKYQLQLMKTRSSSGVGQKIELEFDIDSLRIRDLAEDPESAKFKDQNFRNQFHKFVFISNWQYQRYQLIHGLPYDQKSIILESGIEPAFGALNVEDIFDFKDKEKIRLVYTSTPQRGLEILVPVFEKLCENFDNIHLDVYSSFKIYGWENADKPYEKLFEECDKHPQITNHGSVPQEELLLCLILLLVWKLNV